MVCFLHAEELLSKAAEAGGNKESDVFQLYKTT